MALALAFAGLALPIPGYAGDGRVVVTITDDRITESSALVQSTADPDLAYTINDSGHEPVVYVIELATGDVVGTATLDGVVPEDTEAMAIGADDRLYVGDIGDNDADRDRVALYAIDQPGRGDTVVTPRAYPVRYADGPSDAETLLVDPASGRMAIVTKGLLAGGVYELPDPLRTGGVSVARPVGDVAVPGMVTDGAYLPDGSGVLLRTYVDVAVYAMPKWRELGAVATPRQPQSESLAVRHGGRSVLVGTEKLPSTIVEVRIPGGLWSRLDHGASSEVDSGPAAEADSDDGPGGRWVVASGAAVVVFGAAWLWVRRGQSRGRRRAGR